MTTFPPSGFSLIPPGTNFARQVSGSRLYGITVNSERKLPVAPKYRSYRNHFLSHIGSATHRHVRI